MNSVAQSLLSELEEFYPLLRDMAPNRQTLRDSPAGWSRQEELGHLVDSAQNNIQRFIRAQYQPAVQVNYCADEWVRANDYRGMPWNDLVELWYLLNKQVARILTAMPADAFEKPVDVGAEEPALHPVSYVAEDYVAHLLHHLGHILSLPCGAAA